MTQVEKVTEFAKRQLGAVVENVDPRQATENIRELVKQGKKIQEFSAEDWMEIFGLSEDEIVWGKTQDKLEAVFAHDENAEEIAKKLVESMKEVKGYYALFRSGEMSEVDFLYESEWACLDAVVGILSSYLRQCPIEINILGIVINEEMLNLRYKAIKDELRGEWEDMLVRHVEEQRAQDDALEKKYTDYIEWLEKDLNTYMELLPRAFSDDPEEALAGSSELALFMKLPQAEVLNTVEDVDDFFLS